MQKTFKFVMDEDSKSIEVERALECVIKDLGGNS